VNWDTHVPEGISTSRAKRILAARETRIMARMDVNAALSRYKGIANSGMMLDGSLALLPRAGFFRETSRERTLGEMNVVH
jgi:hypothetical protein